MSILDLTVRTLWHYTTVNRALQIVESGVIKPATAFVPKGEKPAVWFSSNQFWENSCNKGILDPTQPTGTRTATKEEMILLGDGLARIGVAPRIAPYNWEELKKRRGINPQIARKLASMGKKDNYDSSEWRVSFDAVHEDFWDDIQLWEIEKKVWVSIIDKEEQWLDEEEETLLLAA